MQILIEALVYDRAAAMHLLGIDQNAKWQVLQATAKMLAEHIVSDPVHVMKLASQMVINALCIFDGGLPEPLHRHHVFGGLRDRKDLTRLEDLIYSGPLQAHRQEPHFLFYASESTKLALAWLEQLYGALQSSELLTSHLMQVPVLGDLVRFRRVRGLEDCIDDLPDQAFLHVRQHLSTHQTKEAHEKGILRSALLLMDYEKVKGDLVLYRCSSYAFKPADVDQERIIIRALCERGSPSRALLQTCKISQDVIREHLGDLGDAVREQTLIQDLGL
jgi:hypothetical protein